MLGRNDRVRQRLLEHLRTGGVGRIDLDGLRGSSDVLIRWQRLNGACVSSHRHEPFIRTRDTRDLLGLSSRALRKGPTRITPRTEKPYAMPPNFVPSCARPRGRKTIRLI